MLERLHLPAERDGDLWRYEGPAGANRAHHHAELELNLVTAGRGIYLLGRRRYEIHRGDLLWLFPAQQHVLAEQTANFAMWIAVFRRRAVERVAVDPGADALRSRSLAGDACRRLRQHDLAGLEGLFEELAAETAEPAPGSGERSNGGLVHAGLRNAGLSYGLLKAWMSFARASGVPVRELHPAVDSAARLLRAHPAGATLAEVARRVGLSPARLSRLFRAETGSTLVAFRNRQRVEHFQSLYREGRLTLLDAALEAGFGSYAQFHRVFREVAGCSPREYAQGVGMPGRPR